MKKIVLLSAFSLLIGNVYAQGGDRRPPHHDPKKMTEHAAKELGFSEDQNKKLAELNSRYTGDDFDRRKYHEEFRAIMTDEQKEKAREMRRNRPGPDRGRGKPRDNQE